MKNKTESPKNPSAVALGRLNKGVKKTITPERRRQLREQMAKARESRWKIIDK